MAVALGVLGVVAIGLLVMVVSGRQKAAQLTGERDDVQGQLNEVRGQLSDRANELEKVTGELADAKADVGELEARQASLELSVKEVEAKLTEAQESLRKRTELADAQAIQIDVISGERDDLQKQMIEAQERIATLAARSEVVVGGAEVAATDDASALWQMELARSERLWRASVAINPMGDPSPFDDVADPVRKAIEIEAAALREDVGALITVDWRAEPIESPSSRLMVVRVAQEMLAAAAKIPGATTLVVEDAKPGSDGESAGELTMRFETTDDDGEAINLIPPQVSSDLIDIRNETTLTVKASAE